MIWEFDLPVLGKFIIWIYVIEFDNFINDVKKRPTNDVYVREKDKSVNV